MSYEIPKNLRYEEKVIFNLSFIQSAYLAVAAIICGVLATKTPLALEAKLLLCAIIAAIAVGCAFFGLTEHAASALHFYAQPREVGYSSPEMRNFLEVKKIDEGVIYLNDNSAKAVIEAKPINFHMLNSEQKQAAISAYREFLNSLDFSVQVVMRTSDLSLEEYLHSLGKKAARAAAHDYYNELSAFLRGYIADNSVKNRHFYIVMPAEQQLDAHNAARQLEVRAKLCIEKLSTCGVKGTRLGTGNLVGLLSGFLQMKSTGNTFGRSNITTLERNRD